MGSNPSSIISQPKSRAPWDSVALAPLPEQSVGNLVRYPALKQTKKHEQGDSRCRAFGWRKGWDSNPCGALCAKTISSRSRYDLFDTFPKKILNCKLVRKAKSLKRLLLRFTTQGVARVVLVMSCCGAQNSLFSFAHGILTAATSYASLFLPLAALVMTSSIPFQINIKL